MIRELKKLLRNRRIMVWALLIWMLNGLLFYRHCTDVTDGVSMQEIRAQFQRNIDLTEQEDRLWEEIESVFASGEEVPNELLDTYSQVKAAALRQRQAEDYDQTRTELITQSQLKIMLGLFGDKDSFEVRSLERGIEDYQALEGVTTEVGFFGGIELLTDWHMTDLLILLGALLPALMLFAYEREMGLQALTQPTQFGRWRLYGRKFGACLVITLAAALLLLGTNFGIMRVMFGPVSMKAPVQSVYGYAACPMRMSVGEFLLSLLGEKLLWSVCCMSLMVAISAVLGNVTLVIGAIAVVFALELRMGSSTNLWIRWLSLMRLATGEELFQGAIYLNFFGMPMRRLPVCLAVMGALAVAGWITGGVCYCRGSLSGKSRKLFLGHRWLHTNLMLQETKKSLFLRRGAILLLILAGVQWMRYQDVSSYRGTEERYYRQYSEELVGMPSREKEAYLDERQAYFDGILENLLSLEDKYEVGSQEYEAAYSLIANQLIPQSGFEQAKWQYKALQNGQSYVYKTPYEILLGVQRKYEDGVNYAIAFLAITLLLSGFFSGEVETGMAVLQTASGKNKAIFRRKMVQMVIYTGLIAALAFIPRIWSCFAAFGGWDPMAQANSISNWQSLPDWISMRGVFGAQLVKNYLVCLGAGGLVCYFSRRIGSTFLTIVASLCSLLIPVGIVLIAGL